MYCSITATLLALAVILWLRWRRSKFQVFKKLGIPGPEPNILFGNVLEMMEKDPVTCQNQWIKKYGDVLGYYYGLWPTLLVTNPDLLRQIFVKNFSAFTDRPTDFYAGQGDGPGQKMNHSMINLKGKQWKLARSLISPSFSSGKLKEMMPIMKSTVELLVTKLTSASDNGTKDVEMYKLFKGLSMDSISKFAFGVETSVQDNPDFILMRLAKLFLAIDFKSYLYACLVSFREFQFLLQPILNLLLRLYNKRKDPLVELVDLVGEVVKLRKDNPSARRDDLLQTIIDARANNDEVSDHSLTASADISDAETEPADKSQARFSKNEIRLSDEEIEANAAVFFVAGYETTSTALAFLAHYLVNYTDVQDKVREEVLKLFGNDENIDYERLAEMNYADRVISESLRLSPPIWSFIIREANKDVQLGRWKIPAGMTVQVPPYYMQYNSEYFEDPTTFNPDRFLPDNRGKNHSVAWLPFGAGPRNCIGMRLALFQMKLVLVFMLRKFRLEPCAKTEIGNVDLHFHFGVGSPKNGIHVRAVPT